MAGTPSGGLLSVQFLLLAAAQGGALASGFGAGPFALGAVGVELAPTVVAVVAGAIGGAALPLAQAPSALAEPRASHAVRPSLAEVGMRSQGASCRTPCSLPS